MASAVASIVPNRLNRSVGLLACLMAAQLLLGSASCHPEPTPMAAKVIHGR